MGEYAKVKLINGDERVDDGVFKEGEDEPCAAYKDPSHLPGQTSMKFEEDYKTLPPITQSYRGRLSELF